MAKIAKTCMIIGLTCVGLFISYSVLVQYCRDLHREVRSQSRFKLSQIGIGLHNYHDTKGCWAPAAIRDSNRGPLLSWRVAILPFIEDESLYREFHLDEPWDSPHNLTLLPRMPKLYRSPTDKDPASFVTYYCVFVGSGTAFENDQMRLPYDYPDGPSNTIAVVEAGEAVLWTKPDELEFHPNRPLPPFGGILRPRNWLDRQLGRTDSFYALMMDGATRWIDRESTSEQQIRAAITRNGGEKVEWP